MRVWSPFTVLSLFLLRASSEKVGTLVVTIGLQDFIFDDGKSVTITINEKTEPRKRDKPKVSGVIESHVAANFTLTFIKPDSTNETIYLAGPENGGKNTKFPLSTYFPINLKSIRPSTVNIEMQQGDQPNVRLGQMEIIGYAEPLTKRNAEEIVETSNINLSETKKQVVDQVKTKEHRDIKEKTLDEKVNIKGKKSNDANAATNNVKTNVDDKISVNDTKTVANKKIAIEDFIDHAKTVVGNENGKVDLQTVAEDKGLELVNKENIDDENKLNKKVDILTEERD
ncbi:uncharacterized protein LOC132194976 [Neocloeon triangulifer]|uniref:uncharacterized protein LOC132194976 n=1 Tax=Neocloeon triangulifer TaxID=2078957 RepID=UPI00286F1CDD|nr:uncharacterized protein LOC132194976 [Neocloeon triangulifer]